MFSTVWANESGLVTKCRYGMALSPMFSRMSEICAVEQLNRSVASGLVKAGQGQGTYVGDHLGGLLGVLGDILNFELRCTPKEVSPSARFGPRHLAVISLHPTVLSSRSPSHSPSAFPSAPPGPWPRPPAGRTCIHPPQPSQQPTRQNQNHDFGTADIHEVHRRRPPALGVQDLPDELPPQPATATLGRIVLFELVVAVAHVPPPLAPAHDGSAHELFQLDEELVRVERVSVELELARLERARVGRGQEHFRVEHGFGRAADCNAGGVKGQYSGCAPAGGQRQAEWADQF